MTTISFFVPGTPKPQPRQKQRIIFPKGGGRPFAHNYDPGDAEVWKREVRLAAADYVPTTGAIVLPIDLELTFYFARPACHYGTGKNVGVLKKDAPIRCLLYDSDNLAKAVMDALQTVGMYRNDKQCDLNVHRFYAEPGHTGCQIVLVPIEDVSKGLAARTVFAMPDRKQQQEGELRLV